MIFREIIQRRYKKALGFKTKRQTKVYAIRYTGDNPYDVQEFLEQSIFIGPHYSFIRCGQDIIKKGTWIIRHPVKIRGDVLKDGYILCSDRVFRRNYMPWTEEFFSEIVKDKGGKIDIRRDNREIGASESRGKEDKHRQCHKKM